MQQTCVMEYYPPIQRKVPQTCTATWVDLENIMLSCIPNRYYITNKAEKIGSLGAGKKTLNNTLVCGPSKLNCT